MNNYTKFVLILSIISLNGLVFSQSEGDSTSLDKNKASTKGHIDFLETEDYWQDDSLYKFLSVVVYLDGPRRNKLTAHQGLTAEIYSQNDFYIEDDGCKKRALKIIESNYDDTVQIRALFLIDDLESFGNTVKIVHVTGITKGNQNRTDTYRHENIILLSQFNIIKLDSNAEVADKVWYHEFREKHPNSRDNRFRIRTSKEQCE